VLCNANGRDGLMRTFAAKADLKVGTTKITVRLKSDTTYSLQAGSADVLRRGEWILRNT
jgi:hypothetical protein